MWKDLGKFLVLVLEQVGKPYIFGYKVKLDNPDPKAFKDAELVRWAYYQMKIEVPEGSLEQWLWIVEHRTEIPVEVAIWKGGSLVFKRDRMGKICHVGISIGDGTVVEVRGKWWGVVQRQFRMDDWHCAGVIAHL